MAPSAPAAGLAACRRAVRARRHEVADPLGQLAHDGARLRPRRRPPMPPPAPRPARSFTSVVLATAQPLLSAADERRRRATRASVMKTSLNRARPVISRSGRTSTPGWCMSKAK